MLSLEQTLGFGRLSNADPGNPFEHASGGGVESSGWPSMQDFRSEQSTQLQACRIMQDHASMLDVKSWYRKMDETGMYHSSCVTSAYAHFEGSFMTSSPSVALLSVSLQSVFSSLRLVNPTTEESKRNPGDRLRVLGQGGSREVESAAAAGRGRRVIQVHTQVNTGSVGQQVQQVRCKIG